MNYTIEIPDNSRELRQFEKQHPRLYKFIRRLEKAEPNCLYYQLQRLEQVLNREMESGL